MDKFREKIKNNKSIPKQNNNKSVPKQNNDANDIKTPKIIIKKFTIMCTTTCNLNCNNCTQAAIRYPIYHCSMEEVIKLLDILNKSNYYIDELNFTGGEPSLWKNLVPAITKIHKSKIANKISFFTNGIKYKNFNPIIHMIQNIRISGYDALSKENFRKARSIYGNKITFIHKHNFSVLPKQPLQLGQTPKNGWPCICGHNNFCYFKNKVYSCPNIADLFARYPFNQNETVIDLTKFFIKYLKRPKDPCTMCTANPIVSKQLKQLKWFNSL